VWASGFGRPWFHAIEQEADEVEDIPAHARMVFPNMTARMRTARGKRSGIIVVSSGPGGMRVE